MEFSEVDKLLNDPFRSKNEVGKISYVHFTLRCLSALIFGILLIFAFPCFNLSYFAWIGIIPLYLLVMDLKWTKAFIIGFFWGYGWSVASIFWLRSIEPFVPFALAVILAFFYAFWAMAIPLLTKYLLVPAKIQLLGYNDVQKYLHNNFFIFKEPLIVGFLAAWWCIIEWIRTWIFTGFPWNLLAISQWKQIGIIQLASVTGIYGISFLVIFMNLAIADTVINIYKIFTNKDERKHFRVVPFSLYIALVFLLISFYYGIIKAKEQYNVKPELELKAAVVQGDIPQIRFYSKDEAVMALKTYTELSEIILPVKPDILIWPESAVPQPLRGGDFLSLEYRNKVTNLIEKFHVPILLGTIDYDFKGLNKVEFYNSVYLINKEGDFAERYNKMHLVPWGEYTPFEDIWPLSYIYPWIKQKFGMGRSLTPGKGNKNFNLKKDINAGVLICYEGIFPNIAREHVLNDANILITITNDAWYPTKDELEQHIAQDIFRAIENNRLIIRNGNCAGTCVIQPNGLITDSIFFRKNRKGKLVPVPEQKGKGAAVFNISVQKNPKLTFYTKYGNVFMLLCGIYFFIILLFCIWNWKDKKAELCSKTDE